MEIFQQFKALCCLNWKEIRKNIIKVLLELSFPIIIVVTCCFFYANFKKYHDNILPAQNFDLFEAHRNECVLFADFFDPKNDQKEVAIKQIGYHMYNEFTERLMKEAFGLHFELLPFESLKSLEEWMEGNSYEGAAIVFKDEFVRSNFKHLSYSIRLPTSCHVPWKLGKLYDGVKLRQSRIEESSHALSSPYVLECFLSLQYNLVKAFAGRENFPDVHLQAFPYPSVQESVFGKTVTSIFSFLFVACVIYSLTNIIKTCCEDRQKGLREIMKVHGVKSSVYWSSLFLKYLIMLSVPFIVVSFFLWSCFLPFYEYSNGVLIWIFLMLYMSSVVTYGFLTSAIFKSSHVAVNFGLIFFIFFMILHSLCSSYFGQYHYAIKFLLSLFVNFNMGIGVDLIQYSEKNKEGINFSNIFERDVVMNFSFGEVLIFMLVNSFLQMMATIYVDRVFPGNGTVGDAAYFPVKKLVDMFSKKEVHSDPEVPESDANLRIGIEIKNLTKEVNSSLIIEDFSLNCYESQITVLIGHNSAGKTTLMKILAGHLSATSGSAIMNGKIKNLSFCPYENILFDNITVKEHLIFFCKLKGMTKDDEINEEIDRYSKAFNLSDIMNKSIQELSPGIKRKLSVAIALCADTKIVVLDEPSSGMDPGTRRELWNVLIAEKRNRTILLSTHFLDEADVLGDRIAIMSDGTLKAEGSSFELKKKFDIEIVCVKSDHFNKEILMRFVEQIAENYFGSDDFPTFGFDHVQTKEEFTLIFPLTQDHYNSPIYDLIFRKLQENSQSLGITSISINKPSLEDVLKFLRRETLFKETRAISRLNPSNVNIFKASPRKAGFQLWLSQAEAILIEKFAILKRNWKLLLGMLAAFIFLLIMFVIKFKPEDPRDMKISFEPYGETLTVMQDVNSNFSKSYEKLFNGDHHLQKINGDVNDYVAKIAEKNFGKFSKKILIGATFNETITAWFNGELYHTMPLTLDYVNRAILKSMLGDEYDVTTYNEPYEISSNDGGKRAYRNQGSILFGHFILLTSWLFILISPYAKIKETNWKFLQKCSGLNQIVFWCTSFIIDLLIFFIICCITAGTVALLIGSNVINSTEAFEVLLVISFSYGFSMLTFGYLSSFLFRKLSRFSMSYFVTAFGSGFLAVLVTLVEYPESSKIIQIISSFVPSFSTTTKLSIFKDFIGKERNLTMIYTIDEGIGNFLIIDFISGIIYSAIILLIELGIFVKLFYKFNEKVFPILKESSDPQPTDENFTTQRERIAVSATLRNKTSSHFIVRQLSKFFSKYLTVNKIFLDVAPYEIFGIIGKNGCGKSAVLKMMVGEIFTSIGDVFMKSFDMKIDKRKIYELIGYCPESDGLLEDLTVYETLKIFSLIRGFDKNDIDEIIAETARDFGLRRDLDVLIRNLSHGSKRKLSTSLAILGHPKVIFLDQPTDSVDTQARRKIWSTIEKARKNGSSIILSTNSMEECEAVCVRYGVMSNGEFKFIGRVDQLKNDFPKKVLTLTLGSAKIEDVEEKLKKTFSSVQIVSSIEPSQTFTFHIGDDNLQWSEMFEKLEEIKRETKIENYSLQEMSLKQAFLGMTSEQNLP